MFFNVFLMFQENIADYSRMLSVLDMDTCSHGTCRSYSLRQNTMNLGQNSKMRAAWGPRMCNILAKETVVFRGLDHIR